MSEQKRKAPYASPVLVQVGTMASVTRMMAAGPYADGMLGLMLMA